MMEGVVETRSENARHVILSYKDKLYYVSTVKVTYCEGEEVHKAVFHAKDTAGGHVEELDLDIPQRLYEILLEYAKIDESDLILVLHVERKEFKWGLVSESWLRRYTNKKVTSDYVV